MLDPVGEEVTRFPEAVERIFVNERLHEGKF
jgi:hypothetical protein